MTREAFRRMIEERYIVLDGATGSNLRAAGMPVGVCTEQWVMENPKPLQDLQRAYAAAGSDIIYAPTFCANAISLAMYGLQDRMAEMNRALVGISRAAVGSGVLIAGDMTTTGKQPDTEGAPTYEELLTAYRDQARALHEAGVDLFAVETMLGVTECCAAIEGIRQVCDLPIICTLTLDSVGSCYFDGDAEQAVEQLSAIGADAIGINCSAGPDVLEDIVRRMVRISPVPVVAKPNAGMPEIREDGTAVYSMGPGKFAWSMQALKNAGARILGGCCGTTPEHIRALKEIL